MYTITHFDLSFFKNPDNHLCKKGTVYMKPSFASHTASNQNCKWGKVCRNEAARVETLALFQDQVKLLSRSESLVSYPYPFTHEQD